MKFITVLVLSVIFLFPDAKAQETSFPKDTIASRIAEEVLTYSGTWYFKKNSQKVNLGFFAENLRKEVNDFESSKIIFEEALKARRWSLACNLTGLGLLAAGAIVQSQDGDRNITNGLYIGGIIGLSASIPFSFRYNERLHQSIFEHNKATLLQPLKE